MSALSIVVSLLFLLGAYVMCRRAERLNERSEAALNGAKSLNDQTREWLKVSDR
jgi:hypothetical protein